MTINELNNEDGFYDKELHRDVKYRLFNVYVRPKLFYGIENVVIDKKTAEKLYATESKILKTSFGLLDRLHTTPLMQALNIITTKEYIHKLKIELFNRLFELWTIDPY